MTIPHPRPLRRARHRTRAVLSCAALIGAIATVGTVLAPSAGATTINYAGTTSGTQSTITIHRGDSFQRVLHPEGAVTATLDDTNRTVVGGTVALKPSYTPTFTGPFGLLLYVRTDIEQVGQIAGTAVPSSTIGVTDLAVSATTRLRVTVYRTLDGTQHPETDARLSDPVKCFVDLPLTLTGTANRRTGALALTQDPFTIPTFPNGTPDPARTCGLATGSLNQQVAGANNGISLNFTGGPTTAHYTGVSKGTQSLIVIKKGDWIFQRKVNPTGSLVADIDFTTRTVSNVDARFDPINMAALPGILSAAPANAKIDLKTIGTPVATVAPSATPGIDDLSVQTTARMGVTVSLFSNPGVNLTNPSRCFVDIKLALKGTVDRGTDVVTLGSPAFTIPRFPLFGCGLTMSTGLTTMVSGPNNTIALKYVDGVVPA